MTSAYSLEVSAHQDLRGTHTKFFGKSPAKIHVPDFTVHEVFMTTNKKNTLRGLHFQVNPAQPKIITCITGRVLANVVCLDEESEDFKKVTRQLLSKESGSMLVVPPKHALGYRSLEDDSRVLYIAGADFSSEGDVGVDPFDSDLALDWTLDIPGFDESFGREDAILSKRDEELPSFREYMEVN